MNSVGTISFGVLSPSSMSIPTKVMMDMKMEKSLMSFLNWPRAHRDTVLFWEFGSKFLYFLSLQTETLSYRTAKDASGHLGGEIAAELELLERHRHGVGTEEEDEGHEGQVGDVLAGLSH